MCVSSDTQLADATPAERGPCDGAIRVAPRRHESPGRWRRLVAAGRNAPDAMAISAIWRPADAKPFLRLRHSASQGLHGLNIAVGDVAPVDAGQASSLVLVDGTRHCCVACPGLTCELGDRHRPPRTGHGTHWCRGRCRRNRTRPRHRLQEPDCAADQVPHGGLQDFGERIEAERRESSAEHDRRSATFRGSADVWDGLSPGSRSRGMKGRWRWIVTSLPLLRRKMCENAHAAIEQRRLPIWLESGAVGGGETKRLSPVSSSQRLGGVGDPRRLV